MRVLISIVSLALVTLSCTTKNKNNQEQKVSFNEELSKELYKRIKTINTRKTSEAELKQIIDDFILRNNIKVEFRVMDGSKAVDADEDEES
jgi:uncharacterized protein YcfL